MSNVDLAGQNLREWALIILLLAVAIVFVMVAILFALAAIHNPAAVVFKGEFDVNQLITILIGVSFVAVTFVGQQLTAKQVTNAIKENDETWLKDQASPGKPPSG